MKFLHAGDGAVIAQFGEDMSDRANAEAVSLASALSKASLRGIIEIVPTYRSVMVAFDPLLVSSRALVKHIRSLLRRDADFADEASRLVVIPVCYGGERGADLEDVAKHSGLAVEEVILLHSAVEYRINMLGFMPGFPYLSGLDPRLSMPRLATPRVRIPAGSVGIGGAQTGVYPLASPGGWRLIGATPARLYDPARSVPVPFRAGDRIRFVSISESEFKDREARSWEF